jgi:hypothetical protein
MRLRVMSATLVFAAVVGCGPRDGPNPRPTGPAPQMEEEELRAEPNELSNPSMVMLLAHLDRYHGRHIRTEGFLHVRFEDTAIYLSREDAEYLIGRNGFWVAFDRKTVPFEGGIGPKQFDNKYVLVEGTFDRSGRGHGSSFQGTIKVDRVVELKRYK